MYARRCLAEILYYHLGAYVREAMYSDADLAADHGPQGAIEHAEQNIRWLREWLAEVSNPTTQELRAIDTAIRGEEAIIAKHRATLALEAA